MKLTRAVKLIRIEYELLSITFSTLILIEIRSQVQLLVDKPVPSQHLCCEESLEPENKKQEIEAK